MFLIGLIFPFLLTPFLYSAITASSVISSNIESATLAEIPPTSKTGFQDYVSIRISDPDLDRFDPYLSALNLDGIYLAVGVTALVLSIALGVLALAGRSPKYQNGIVQTLGFALVAASAGWLITRAVPSNGWDETFLMVSQIDGVLNGNGNRVWLTGPQKYSESSTDVGFIWLASAVRILFHLSSLQAIFLTNALGFALMWLYLHRRLRQAGQGRLFVQLALISLLLVSPQFIGASSAGFPTIWQTFALLILFSECIRERPWLNPRRYAASILFAIFIRPESLFVCIVVTCALLVRVLRESTRNDQQLSFSTEFKFAAKKLTQPYLLLSCAVAIKFLLYGQIVPTAIYGKQVELTGDFLFAGIGYLERTISEGGAGVYISAAILLIALHPKRRLTATLALFVAVLPGLMIGGDLFPAYWARYVLPALFAFVLVLMSSLLETEIKEVKLGSLMVRYSPLVVGLMVALITINLAVGSDKLPWNALRQSTTFGRDDTDYQSPVVAPDSWAVRPVCLARAGRIARLLLPEGVGIATTELNTLAYFANQPLTDLFGLADSRTGRATFDPLQAGFWGFKRRNPEIIDEDMPGVLYESAGLSCRVGRSNYGDARSEINTALVNGDTSLALTELSQIVDDKSFRYRFGDPARIVEKYVPVNLSTEGDTSILIFLRKDLLGHVSERSKAINAELEKFSLHSP